MAIEKKDKVCMSESTTGFKDVHIFGGGTVYHIRPHLALSAPAYGNTAITIGRMVKDWEHANTGCVIPKTNILLRLTKMADSTGYSVMETNEDVARAIDQLLECPRSKIIFMNAALCDFEGSILEGLEETESGKDKQRLRTSDGKREMLLRPSEKVLGRIRRERKDIFLVAFKTTAGATPDEQFKAGMNLLKTNGCNLVLANDVHTRNNMILTPEMSSYGNTTNRTGALKILVDMAIRRSRNEFTRTEMCQGRLTPFARAPEVFKKVVNHCIDRNAYTSFNDTTVGHFGFRPPATFGRVPNSLFSSRRKQNYNKVGGTDLIYVNFDSDVPKAYHGKTVTKPSAGVRSQHELLAAYPEFDSVVHFHCPLKSGHIENITIRQQKYFECGSQQCGENTTAGIRVFSKGNTRIAAVMLEKHGPNILFNSDTSTASDVIDFIEENFNLSERTK